jgi:hypothetical protein
VSLHIDERRENEGKECKEEEEDVDVDGLGDKDGNADSEEAGDRDGGLDPSYDDDALEFENADPVTLELDIRLCVSPKLKDL